MASFETVIQAEQQNDTLLTLRTMDSDIRTLQGEVSCLAERMRSGDPSAYKTYKFRKRELKELSRRLKEFMKKEHRRSLSIP